MYNSVAIINRCLKEKKLINHVSYSDNNLNIIRLLYNSNYILFYRIKYNKILFEFNLHENKIILNLFSFYKTNNNNRYIEYNKLKYLFFVKNKKLLLNTNRGIINIELAIKYKIGGIILLQYN